MIVWIRFNIGHYIFMGFNQGFVNSGPELSQINQTMNNVQQPNKLEI